MRFPAVSVALLLFATMSFPQSLNTPPGWNTSGAQTAVAMVRGFVRSSDGSGVPGASVDFRDASAVLVSSTTTDPTGAFEVGPLSKGRYEIQVEAGTRRVRDSVLVSMGLNPVVITLSSNPVSADAPRPTVSVAELKVPEKARNAYKDAAKAYREGKLVKVEKFLRKALTIYPKYPAALTMLGLLRLKAHQFADAEQPLQSAIENDPKPYFALIALGAVHNAEQRYEDATSELERGIKLRPDYWWGYYELARVYLAREQYEAALAVVARSEKNLPQSVPLLHLPKASALAGLKNYQAAKTELESYLQADPSGPGAAVAHNLLSQFRDMPSRGSK